MGVRLSGPLVGRGKELARLLPELGRPERLDEAGPDWRSEQARLFELVLGLLERLAVASPLVLVVEDLHWADRSSLELLAFLAHGLEAAPVVVVGTYRSVDAGGRTNQQIAEELFISVKTAGIHVSNILAKLGVGTRVEAAAAAHRGGLLDDPAP